MSGTALRQRYIEDLQLAGKRPRTVESYVRYVRQLAEYFGRSPALLEEDDLRQYFLYVKNVKGWRRKTMTGAICAVKFLWEVTLRREWTALVFIRPPKEKTMPTVLTFEEVRQVLAHVSSLRFRACLTLIYSCGLRLGEGVAVKVHDMDTPRGVLRVNGKGNKQREVPLCDHALKILRQFYKTHRNPTWLFPNPGRGCPKGAETTAMAPMPIAGVQKAMAKAVTAARIRKPATVHTLRHSWATHMLEQNIDLRTIQEWLGHNSPQTTSVYTHLAQNHQNAPPNALRIAR